jgi:hypothetical protein
MIKMPHILVWKCHNEKHCFVKLKYTYKKTETLKQSVRIKYYEWSVLCLRHKLNLMIVNQSQIGKKSIMQTSQ